MEIQNSDQSRSSTNNHLSYNLLPHLKLKVRIIAELKIAISNYNNALFSFISSPEELLKGRLP